MRRTRWSLLRDRRARGVVELSAMALRGAAPSSAPTGRVRAATASCSRRAARALTLREPVQVAVEVREQLRDAGRELSAVDQAVAGVASHVNAVRGQLRAVAGIAGEIAEHRAWALPALPEISGAGGGVAAAVEVLRANLTLRSPAMRHAVRLAAALGVATAVSRTASTRLR